MFSTSEKETEEEFTRHVCIFEILAESFKKRAYDK